MSFHDFDVYEQPVGAAQATDALAHLIVRLGGEVGLRCGETMALRWSDIDLNARKICGPLVLCSDDGSALTLRRVQGLVWRAARHAGIRNGVHVLRHTFRSHLATRGGTERAVQTLAGHRHLTTTERYMHLSPTAIDQTIRLLDPPMPRADAGEILETETATVAIVNRHKGN
jgi:integrase